MKRESFVFYESFYDAIKTLEKDDQFELFLAITEYGIEGTIRELQGVARGMFALIKPQIDANNRKWVNGKKGGRPSKTNGFSNQETIGFEENNPNGNDNVNGNGNGNENGNDNAGPGPDGAGEFIDLEETFSFPNLDGVPIGELIKLPDNGLAFTFTEFKMMWPPGEDGYKNGMDKARRIWPQSVTDENRMKIKKALENFLLTRLVKDKKIMSADKFVSGAWKDFYEKKPELTIEERARKDAEKIAEELRK